MVEIFQGCVLIIYSCVYSYFFVEKSFELAIIKCAIFPLQANLQYLAAKAEKVPMSSNSLGVGQFLIFKSGEDWFRGAVVKLKRDKQPQFPGDEGKPSAAAQ